MDKYQTALRSVRRAFDPVLLGLMLSTDAVFVLLHVLHKLLSLPNDLLSLKTDGGYSEVFQYIKEYWIAIVLFAMCWRRREGVYAVWALLFAYLLCDDALSIHEAVGRFAAANGYSPALGLRAQDLGELTFFAAIGSAFLVLMGYCYRRGSDAARDVSKDLALLLALLVFFGAFVDMAHIALPIMGLSLVEEGGEMIAMSLIVSYVVHLLEREEHVPGLLWQSAMAPLTGRWRRRGRAAHKG